MNVDQNVWYLTHSEPDSKVYTTIITIQDYAPIAHSIHLQMREGITNSIGGIQGKLLQPIRNHLFEHFYLKNREGMHQHKHLFKTR